MPMPWSYRHATRDWQAFLADAKDRMGLQSDNMAYTAVQAVLLAFRARLTAQQALQFAQPLPAVLRAIFIDGLQADQQPRPLPDSAALIAEVKALRPNHNMTPDNAIEATAYALWRAVNHADMQRVLGALAPELAAFWDVPGEDSKTLERQIT